MLERALAFVGLDPPAVTAWSDAVVAHALHEGWAHSSLSPPVKALEVLSAVAAMARARTSIDATLLVCVQDLLLRAGEKLLAERGVDDVSSLSRTAHQTWRAHTKAAVAGELQVALGVGVSEARQMVALAAAPGRVRVPVLGALRRGEVSWALVRRFQSRTSRLEPDGAADVARLLFGTDPAEAAAERLDPDGALVSRPWHHAEYYAALDREVARVQGRDERAARERRRVALSLRDARLDVSDDGTATLSVSGSLATMLAVNGRIDSMARRCRKGGDERTLAQLRADIVASLAIFGTVDLPGPAVHASDDLALHDSLATSDHLALPDDLVTPDDVEALAAVINATPSGQVDLVVPWDALAGGARVEGGTCPSCAGRPSPARGGVGELRGHPSAWVTPEEARDIALRPGSVLHRLLTDPADGRCLERSIARYSPDAEMRRQIRAADGYGRGPGCRRPAATCELDHERPWGEGGPTAEPNLNAKSRLDHFRKTKRLWSSVMNVRRDVTWTTLLGQVARTRGHDYRQYLDAFLRSSSAGRLNAGGRLSPGGPGADGGTAEPLDDRVDRADLADRRDLAGQVLYAALVSRRPGERAQAEDDVEGCEDWLCVSDWGSIAYRDTTGRRRFGIPPDAPTPEQVLGLSGDTGHRPSRSADRPTTAHEPPPF